jgi:integrase/recombinase XerD
VVLRNTVTLNRPDAVARLPYPKVPRPLLDIPSPGEVAKVLAAARTLKYRMVLFCAYGAGLRVREACELCVGDIDSKTRALIRLPACTRRPRRGPHGPPPPDT